MCICHVLDIKAIIDVKSILFDTLGMCTLLLKYMCNLLGQKIGM